MIAPSRQLPRAERFSVLTDPSGAASRRDAWICGLLGFSCMLPYPALPVGTNSAAPMGLFVALAVLVPLLFKSWRKGPLWLGVILLAPELISTMKIAVSVDGDLDMCLKTLLVWGASFIALAAAQACAARSAVHLLTGIAFATLLHAAVGAWQFVSFSFGEFPIPWIYVNPSFWSVQDTARTIALYIQRPFGLFPEPSAMACSLAPWVLFWLAELLGLVRLRQTPARWQRILFAAASASGLGLIILSRSGHTAITMVGVIVLVGVWFARCRATASSYLALLGVFAVVLPVVGYFAVEALADRMGGDAAVGNSSWEDRSNSLIIGFRLWIDSDLATVLFGMGPGYPSPTMWRMFRLEAVWSVLLTYIYECGLLGAFVAMYLGGHLLHCWKWSGRHLVFAVMLANWLVGITLTTSYMQLLSLWVILGWLTVWTRACHPSDAPASLPDYEPAHAEPVSRAFAEPRRQARGWRIPFVDPQPSLASSGRATS